MDSLASTMQFNFFFGIFSDAVAFVRINAPVSLKLMDLGFLLQGMAAATCLSNFLLAFLMMSLYSSSSGSIE